MWNSEYCFVELASPYTMRILGLKLRWSFPVQVLLSHAMHWLFFSPFKCSLFINFFPQNYPKYWEWTGVKQWKTGLVDIVSQLGVLRSHSNRMRHWCHNQFCFKGWPLLNCIWMDLSIWLSLYSRDYGERSGPAITDIDCLGNANL